MRYPALAHASFRVFLLAGFVSNIGTWMQSVARSWVIYRQTGDDPRWLGWLGLSFAIPMVLLPPLGGALVDRLPRVRLLLFTQSTLAGIALLLAILTWTGALRPWHILACTFAGATVLAVDNPARQAVTPDLVPREHLSNALSLNAASFNGAALIGPAIAGGLLSRLSAGWLFFSNALSFVFMIAAIASLRFLGEANSGSRQDSSPTRLGQEPRAKLIVAVLATSAVVALFGRSYPQLLPVFANDVWRAGASGYGNLLAAGGAGAILGGLGAASFSARFTSIPGLMWSGSILALSLVCFGATSHFSVGVGALVLAGASATVATTGLATMLQSAVLPQKRGRVMGLYVVTLIGLPQLAAPVLAHAATRFVDSARGASWVVAMSGVLLALGLAVCGSGLGRFKSAD